MSLSITAEPIPTGRAVYLEFGTTASPAASAIILERQSSQTNTWETIYKGAFCKWFIDAGELQSVPLDPAYTYTYRLSDNPTTSSVTSSGVNVNAQVRIIQDPTESTLIRLIEGAVNSLTPPTGYKKIRYLHEMPLTGFPQMPIVTMNLDLLQQEEIPLGLAHQIQLDPTSYINTIQERRYSIYILSTSSQERNYYQEAVSAVVYNLANTFLNVGGSIRFAVQATQGQTREDNDGKTPGFFYAQIMLIISFQYKTTLVTDIAAIGDINEIDTAVSGIGTYTNK